MHNTPLGHSIKIVNLYPIINRAKVAKKCIFFFFFKFLGQTWLLWCLFEIWTYSKLSLWKTLLNVKIVFLKHFLTKFWLEIIFRKDNFEKYKNFGHKVFFRKIIFTFKSVFHKDNFERVHISNKHHKSHVWPKNLKKRRKKSIF